MGVFDAEEFLFLCAQTTDMFNLCFVSTYTDFLNKISLNLKISFLKTQNVDF